MFVLKKSFGCLSLRTGGLFIGWLGVVGVAFAMIICVIFLGLSIAGYVSQGDLGVEKCLDIDDKVCESITTMHVIVLSIILVILFIYMLPSLLLVIGIYKNRRGYLKLWLIMAYISLVLIVIAFLFHTFTASWAESLSELIAIAIDVYLHSIVHSVYHEMETIKYTHV